MNLITALKEDKNMNGIHKFDGLLISERVIDDYMLQTKGRVSRQEAKELAMVADRIRQQRDAAMDYINLTLQPGNENNNAQEIAYNQYLSLINN